MEISDLFTNIKPHTRIIRRGKGNPKKAPMKTKSGPALPPPPHGKKGLP